MALTFSKPGGWRNVLGSTLAIFGQASVQKCGSEAMWSKATSTRISSVALDVLRANDVQNVNQALYANAVSFDQLLALSTA